MFLNNNSFLCQNFEQLTSARLNEQNLFETVSEETFE